MDADVGDLEIKQLQTSKDDIKQPALAKHKNMYIAPLGSSVLICGKSGSGKSTLLTNLITDKRFYKGWFKKIFLFSPTASGDDVQRSLQIPQKHVFTDLEMGPALLDIIIKSQKEKLKGGGKAGKVDQYAVIFDDVIGDTKFMNDKSFIKCFYQVRHVNCTTFICSQHFKRVPRVCRLQANFVHYFACSQTEVDTLTEEFCPPRVNRKVFAEMVNDATEEPYSFFTINMKVPWKIRFRKNLGEIIQLPTNGGEDEQRGRGPRAGERAGGGAAGDGKWIGGASDGAATGPGPGPVLKKSRPGESSFPDSHGKAQAAPAERPFRV